MPSPNVALVSVQALLFAKRLPFGSAASLTLPKSLKSGRVNDDVGVLSSREYLARFQNQTPWSRRCLGKAVVFKRWVCEQVEPGAAEPHPAARALLLNRESPGALQVRRFVSADRERITLCELPDSKGVPGIVYRLYQP